MKLECSLPYSQQPTTFISLGRINPLQALSSCFFKNYFNIILLCLPMSSKFSVSFRCPHQDAIGTPLLLRSYCMCNPSSLYVTPFKANYIYNIAPASHNDILHIHGRKLQPPICGQILKSWQQRSFL